MFDSIRPNNFFINLIICILNAEKISYTSQIIIQCIKKLTYEIEHQGLECCLVLLLFELGTNAVLPTETLWYTKMFRIAKH